MKKINNKIKKNTINKFLCFKTVFMRTTLCDAVIFLLLLVLGAALICFAFAEEKRVRTKIQKKILIEHAQRSIDWSSADVCSVAKSVFERNMLSEESMCNQYNQ